MLGFTFTMRVFYTALKMEEFMSGKCKCAHHFMVPLLIVIVAVIVFLGNVSVLSASLTGILWPIALALIGLMKMCDKGCKCCSKGSGGGESSGPSC